jgi:hypothetical protein
VSLLKLTGSVQGVDDTIRRFSDTKAHVIDRLRTVMAESAQSLKAGVGSGAASFKSDSGRLMRSVFGFTKEKGDTVTAHAGVGRRAYYARFLEKGVAREQVNVRAHVRAGAKVKAKVLDTATGKSRRRIVSQQIGYVQAHPSTVYVPAKPFIQPTYQTQRAYIESRILAAVRTGVK